MRRVILRALLAATVMGGLFPATGVLPTPGVRATHATPCPIPPGDGHHVVHVGGGDLVRRLPAPEGCGQLPAGPLSPDEPLQLMAYYPGRLSVHRGDVVEFRFSPGYAGWHSVTFSPVDVDVARHPEPSEDAHPHLLRGDEGRGSAAFHEEWVFGRPRHDTNVIACGMRMADEVYGRPAQDRDGQECVLDPQILGPSGATVSSSMGETFPGMISPSPFVVRVDLPPGTYRYHCKEHPTMHGIIDVLPDDAALPSPEDVEAAAMAELAADVETGRRLVRAHDDAPSVAEDGRRRWTVRAGVTSEDGRVSVHGYLPANLEVRPGDVVEWLHGSVGDPHTVSFPKVAGGGFGVDGACGMYACTMERFVPWGLGGLGFPWFNCELDDPRAGLPAQPLWRPGRGCTAGAIEWPMVPWTIHDQPAPGGAVTTPATVHSSAMLATRRMPDGEPTPAWTYEVEGAGWSLGDRFEATFPDASEEPFTYICHVHPDLMTGSITVTAA